MSAMDEAELVAVMEAFGWEVTDEFRRRYLTDALIYNLANALVATWRRLTQLNEGSALDTDPGSPTAT